MINLLSSGEIQKGMFIVPYESKQIAHKKESVGLFGISFGESQPLEENGNPVFIDVFSPWFKGIPYEVLGVAGPIIAVKNIGQHIKGSKVAFFDSRLVKFFEVEESFYKDYSNEILQNAKNNKGNKGLDTITFEEPDIKESANE